jgi:sec-independent protein translocase protein TatA
MTTHLLLFLDSLGTGELFLIVMVVFLFFGPQKMPEIARKLGKVMNDMKKASNDITKEFNKQASPLRDEFVSAGNDLKKQVDDLKQEITSTKNIVLESLSTDPKPVPETPAGSNNSGAKAGDDNKANEPSPPDSEIAG